MIPIKKNSEREIMLNWLLAFKGHDSVESFQSSSSLVVDGIFGQKSYGELYKQVLNVEDIDFNGSYTKEIYRKKQLILHHSAGWDNARGMFDYWKNDGVLHVATSIGIVDDGKVIRGFDESYWAHHIGMRNTNNLIRNMESVGVEVCNWGALSEKNGKYYSWANVEIPESKVIELDYKGIKYFEKYTQQEVDSLELWMVLNSVRFDIPLDYKPKDVWSLSNNAINGEPGFYTHNSYIPSKSDMSPQPIVVDMFNNIKSKFLG